MVIDRRIVCRYRFCFARVYALRTTLEVYFVARYEMFSREQFCNRCARGYRYNLSTCTFSVSQKRLISVIGKDDRKN